MIEPDNVTAVILTGGRSTRMGRNKALIPVGGKPLIAHAIDGLSAVFTRILLSANDPETYQPFGFPVVQDVEPEWGALAGVHAGLLVAPTEWIFALAVDMPLVEPAAIRAVLAHVAPNVAAVIPHGHGFHQPFHAAYGPESLNILREHKDQEYHVHDFAEDARVLHLSEEEMKAVSPSLECFLNANTPEDLEEIAVLLKRRDPKR